MTLENIIYLTSGALAGALLIAFLFSQIILQQQQHHKQQAKFMEDLRKQNVFLRARLYPQKPKTTLVNLDK